MHFLNLINKAQRILDPFNVRLRTFQSGAEWMRWQLIQIRKVRPDSLFSSHNYSAYGILKYGFCFLIFGLTAWLLTRINIWYGPLSILGFLLAQIPFLFLFPLLIDNKRKPLNESVNMLFRTGLVRVLFNSIPIGIYMLIGFLNLSNPLLNWYRGRLAILLWYEEELALAKTTAKA